MGKIKVLISTTPDGFADAQNVIIDPAFFDFTHSLMADTAIAAFGKNTFEIFQERWPQRLADENTPVWLRKMAKSLHDIPKIVFSTTLKNTTWNNSSIVKKLDNEYVRAFKREHTGSMLTFGSIGLIETLTEMDVVDEYYFNIQPVIPGNGTTRFFSKLNLKTPHPLAYTGFTQLSSGAHVIHYRRGDGR